MADVKQYLVRFITMNKKREKIKACLCLFLIIIIGLFLTSAKKESDNLNQLYNTAAKNAIESAIESNSIITKETEKFKMEVRNLDDGSKEVRIEIKDSVRKEYYFIVYEENGRLQYRETKIFYTGFYD